MAETAFCKYLRDPFVVDVKPCNYSSKKCVAGRARVKWNFDMQKPASNPQGVNGYVDIVESYDGGPVEGETT